MSQGTSEQHLADNFTHEYIITPTFGITIRMVLSALKYITAVAKNEVGSATEGNKRLFESIIVRVCFDIKVLEFSFGFTQGKMIKHLVFSC